MARSYLILACVLAVAFGSAYADEPERLVSGVNAAPGEFPYAASLRQGRNHFCGGAIIGNYAILTAAHCVVGIQNPGMISVVTGTNSIIQGGNTYRAARIFVHPQYNNNRNWYNDIAVIQLASPIQFNRLQNKINLPTSNPPPNSNGVVCAWGNTAAPPRGRLSNNLQKLNLNILSTQDCQRYHQNPIYDTMICTLNQRNVGTCNGDSGSPLVRNNQVIGVVSGGIPCALGYPDIFTNVYKFVDWVRRHTS